MTGAHDGEWYLRARCRGLPADVFFTEDQLHGQRRLDHEDNAKRICCSCPVRVRCRDYSVNAQERYGIWGGTTPRERAAVQRSAQSAAS